MSRTLSNVYNTRPLMLLGGLVGCAALALPGLALAEKVKPAGVSASSSYPPEDGVSYEPDRAKDGKLSTAWVEGDEGSGLGSWLEIDLGGTRSVQRLKIWGGLWYSGEYWERANRPKDIEVSFADGSVEKFTLADEMKAQEFTLAKPVSTSTVRIKVESVHSGTTWYDTAISEVQVFDANPDSVAPVASAVASSVATADADGAYPPINVTDGIVDSMWCEGVEDGDGTGEWLELNFSGSRSVSHLHLVNGMGTSIAFWMKANRATAATLEFSDGSTERVAIKNSMMPQDITFAAHTTSKVKIKFDEVARGKEFNDLCISEAYFTE